VKRKTKIILGGVFAGVLMAGIVGGVALAKSADSSTGNTLFARAATILGISEQSLQDAFSQAQKEIQAENLDTYLKSLVADGKITQAQADEYKQWWQSKPGDIPALNEPGEFGGHMRHGFSGGQMMNPQDIQTTTTKTAAQ
jgi:hypothetical protein